MFDEFDNNLRKENAQVYPEPSQISKMELPVNKSTTFFTKVPS